MSRIGATIDMALPLFVIAYDVGRSAVRRRVAARLESEMIRVQYSLFEGHLSARRAQQLFRAVSAMADIGDRVRLYRLAGIGGAVCQYGDITSGNDEGFWFL